MIELQTVTTKAKNPSTNEFQDVTWGGINVLSTSGTTNYNNLTNKPTINGVTVQGSLTTGDLLITAADVGALPSGTKYGADFALSIDSQTFVVTAQLKDQDGNNLGQAKTIDLPLETMVVGGSYDDTTQKVILTLKNGQAVEFSVADLVSGLQSEITLSNKLDADLVDDSTSANKFVTASDKTNWNAKSERLTILTYGTSTWNDFITAYENNAIVYCKAYMTGAQTRLAFMAYIDNDSAPTYVEFQYYRSVSSKNLSNQCDQVIVYKLDNTGTWTTTTRNTDVKFAAGTALGTDFASNTLTFKHQNSGVTAGTYDSVTVDAQGHVTAGSNYTIDSTPTVNSQNLVTSGGVYDDILSAYGGIVGKNAAKENDFTATLNKTVYCNPITGTIHISAANVSSTDTDSTICRILLYYTDGTVSSNNLSLSRGSNISLDVNIGAKILEKIVIYASDTYNNSIGDTVTVSDLMICTQADYATNPTYQPYAMSNIELTVENASQQSEIDYAVNTGVKNLLKIDKSQIKSSYWNIDWTWSGDTASNGNASITINQDNTFTVTVSNTMTAQVIFDIYLSNDDVSNVILSGCPSGGSSSTHFMYVKGTSYYDTGNGVTFSKTGSFRIAIVVASGHTAGTYIFKPMLRPASITDSTFQPYALPNPVITPALIEQVDGGAKNVLNFTSIKRIDTNYGTSVYTAGVRFVLNTDGSITATREESSIDNSFVGLCLSGNTSLIADDFCDGEHVLSGCPSGGSNSTYRLYAAKGTYAKYDTGNGVILTSTAETGIVINCIVYSGFSGTVTFKPMICTKAAWDVSHTYEPYALPNPTLTPAVIKAVDEGAKNLSSVSSGIISNSGGGFPIPTTPITIPIGTYIVSFKFSGNATRGSVQFRSGSTKIDFLAFDMAPSVSVQIDITTDTIDNFNLYSNGTATISEFMICSVADYAVSQKFVPYAPTNRELYEGKTNEVSINITNNLDATFVDKNNSNITIFKHGELCIARVSLKVETSALTGADTLTSIAIPSEYRPQYNVYETVSSRDVGGWAASVITCSVMSVETDGNIILRTGTNAASTLYVIGTLIWHL